MLKAVISYGAVSAKLHALKGRLLSDADFEALGRCESLGEVGAYLRRTQGYSQAMAALPASRFSADQLQSALKSQWLFEFQRLYRFASQQDRHYLNFAVWRTELSVILSALRRLLSPNGISSVEAVSPFFRQKSGVDLDAAAACRDFTTLRQAMKNSIFYDTLISVPRDSDTGLPDYAFADIALKNYWYKRVWAFMEKGYSGTAKQNLIEFIGREADALNIVSALRLRRFPSSAAMADQLLIPVGRKLKPDFALSLAQAKTDQEAEALLAASVFGKEFPKGVSDPEGQYRERTEAFCRKLLASPQPNLCGVQAYLTLKELELDKIIMITQLLT